ncbi:MAG: hypothetical protein QW416_06495 [Candidatus Nitrosocaldaceae archaeon]
MNRECPECNGEMYYESNTKHFICKQCGLYATREDIYEILERKKPLKKKKSKEDEYLDWWLSSKK